MNLFSIDGIPDGYIPGVFRGDNGQNQKTHLYKGDFSNPGLPMCLKGWHRGDEYSIFRNNISKKGICKTCMKRANLGLDGLEAL